MNRNVALMIVIALCVLEGNAFCADWKYYGEFTTTPDVEEILFYDSKTCRLRKFYPDSSSHSPYNCVNRPFRVA